MYGNLALLNGKTIRQGERVYIGEMKGKDEAWLRDTLFDHPHLIPVAEIDRAFAPLLPVCTELRTDAGNVDALFVNHYGRLTLLECKLWKNPQARREVVAQTLDYVGALSRWSYADLQRQVSAATGTAGNVLLDVVKSHSKPTRERDFVDSVSRSLQQGRFLVLIAGDGIREGVQPLTELVNRNSSHAFTFGVVEVAIYKFAADLFAIQPRVIARTEIVARHVFDVHAAGTGQALQEQVGEARIVTRKGARDHLRAFWQPLLDMRFDDPEQEPPKFIPATNNLSLTTPFPGIRIKAYAVTKGNSTGVFLSSTNPDAWRSILPYLRKERRYLAERLPKGTSISVKEDGMGVTISTDEFRTAEERRLWLRRTINDFVNVLRPRLRKWHEESQM